MSTSEIKSGIHSNSRSDYSFDASSDREKEPSIIATEESRGVFDLKPRFTEDSLRSLFFRSIAEAQDTLIEEYEVELFEICKLKKQRLYGVPLSFRCMNRYRHLRKLNKIQDTLALEDKQQLEFKLEEVFYEEPSIEEEYILFKKTLRFISRLTLKLKFFTPEDYNYRITGRSQNVMMVDLAKLNKSLMTMETVWFTCAIYHSPLDSLVDENTLQLARILNTKLVDVFESVFEFNSHINFEEVPEINSALAKKNKKYRKKVLGTSKLEDLCEVPFQKLSMGSKYLFCCSSNDSNLKNFFKDLRELEMAYQAFEKALIETMVSISGQF